MKTIVKLSLLVGVALGLLTTLVTSCSDKDTYSYNDIEPIILSITGPNKVAGHGINKYPATYSVPTRGGSTFTWSLANNKWGGNITVDPERSHIAKIVFNEAPADTLAIIQVVETTYGGKTSPVKTMNVTITKFCQFNVENFTGLYDCDEPGYAHYDVNFTKVNDSVIIADNFWDSGWDVQYLFHANPNQTVEIIPWSYTTSSGTTYEVTGSGTFDGCTGSFKVNYVVKKNGANYDVNTHTFTKKGGKSIPQPGKKIW